VPVAVAPPPAEPAGQGPAAKPVELADAPSEAEATVSSVEEATPAARPERAEAEAATAEPAGLAVEAVEPAETEAAAEDAPVAAPTEEAPAVSLRSQVEAQLEESARLLSELREAAAGTEEGSASAGGSVEIMEEGLDEIRALAERKQWGPARDKGKALHAQLTLLLQNARREASP
jgi:ribonuclease E